MGGKKFCRERERERERVMEQKLNESYMHIAKWQEWETINILEGSEREISIFSWNLREVRVHSSGVTELDRMHAMYMVNYVDGIKPMPYVGGVRCWPFFYVFYFKGDS